ncbi:MAG: nucleotide sugar dehydrogenase [Thermoplasmata archaeon]
MRQPKVAVVGLGYVGIPLSALLADSGCDVVGVDVVAERALKINEGILPLSGEEPGLADMLRKVVRKGGLRASTEFGACSDRDAVFVCVDTPMDDEHRPNNSRLQAAATGIGEHMRKGTLVVVESTVAPGTMLKVFAPALERASKMTLGKDFKLAHCPERVMPGRLLHNLTTYDRVLGGYDRQSVARAKAIYSRFMRGELHTTDLATAETVKTAENAYRDVQIAFANEVALMCEHLGVDAFEVRRLVNTCPFRDMHVPGAGVGGHCLPKDPWLLVHGGKAAKPRLIPTARAVNDSMPAHVVDLAERMLDEAKIDKRKANVAIMGASFLQDSGDIRNSPSLPVIHAFKRCARLSVHDPYVAHLDGTEATKDMKGALEDADIAIFMVAHKQYARLTPATLKGLMRTPMVVDGRDLFSADRMRRAGVKYAGVGKGKGFS